MDERVSRGQAVSIKASTWNSFVEAAEFARNAKRLVGAGPLSAGIDGNTVLVKNTGDSTVPRFGAIVLGDSLVAHDAASDSLECDIPAFDGAPAEAEEEDGSEGGEGEAKAKKDIRPFAVAVEPIAAGEIGRALALGVTPAKVNVIHEEDTCAEPVPGSSSGAMRTTHIGYARIIWKDGGTGEKWCFLRLGAAEPSADEKSIDFAARDPESDSSEDADAAKTEHLEIKGFCSKDAEEETLGERLMKPADEATAAAEGEEEEKEDELILRSGDRKKIKFMKIGRGASSVEVDDISVDFTKANPEEGGSDSSTDPDAEEGEGGERTNKVQVHGFDSKDAEGQTLAQALAERDVECEDEVVVRSADRKSLKYIKIGGSLVTGLAAGENITLELENNVITISADVGEDPGEVETSGYSTAKNGTDEEIVAIRYHAHDLQVRKATKVYENGLLKSRTVGDWTTFTTAVEETV